MMCDVCVFVCVCVCLCVCVCCMCMYVCFDWQGSYAPNFFYYRSGVSKVLYCIVLYCTALYCTVILCCTVHTYVWIRAMTQNSSCVQHTYTHTHTHTHTTLPSAGPHVGHDWTSRRGQ